MHPNNHFNRNTLVLNTTHQYENHYWVHSICWDDVTRIWYPSSTAEKVQSIIVPDTRFISLQGDLWAGKSKVARLFQKQTGIERISGGTFIRDQAIEKGISTAAMAELAKSDPRYDIEADTIQVKTWEGNVPAIVDGRVWPITIPHSLKVLMIVDPEVAAQRIYDEYVSGGRQWEAAYNSVTDVLIANQARKQSDEERYLQIYGLRVSDTRLYDMVIDTTHMQVDEVVEAICWYKAPRDKSILHIS